MGTYGAAPCLLCGASQKVAEKFALFLTKGLPIEIACGVLAGGLGDLAAALGIGQERGDAGGEAFGRVADPDAVAVQKAESGASGGGGNDGAAHRHSFEDLYIRAGGDGGGSEHQVGLFVERADIGDEAEQADARIGGGLGLICESAPVGEMIRAADHGYGGLQKFIAEQRPDLLGEKTERGDVREMPEGADKENLLAGRFGRGREAGEIDAVLYDRAVRWGAENFGILLRHDDDAAESADGALFETAPTEKVPAAGGGAFAPGDLTEKVEGDVVL